MAILIADITSVSDLLRSGHLVSEHDWQAWLVLLLAAVAGLMAGRLAAWALRRLAERNAAGGHASRPTFSRAWPGPPPWPCSRWGWNWASPVPG